MPLQGSEAYRDPRVLPPLVRCAVDTARAHAFPVLLPAGTGAPARGAGRGAGGAIAETGTGRGVRPAWPASGAPTGTRLVSVERDPERARATGDVFRGRRDVRIMVGGWRRVEEHGPYDLLVLDGGGRARGDGRR